MSLDPLNHLGQTVGAKLREARLAKKYTQNQLAQPDFSVSYVSAIERGQIQPSLRALEIFARRLGMSSTHLLAQFGQEGSGRYAEGGNQAQIDEEREWALVEAQIALYQGQPAQAIEILRPLLERKGEVQQQVALCYVLGWAYLAGGHVQESESLLAEAAHLAQVATSPLYPRILYVQGEVYASMHRLEQAMQCQRASLAVLQQSHDMCLRIQVYTSLGQTYSQLGEMALALEMFQQALALIQPQAAWQALQQCYGHLAAYYQEHAEPMWATLARVKGEQAHVQSQFSVWRGQLQHALGRVLLQSQPDQAYAYLHGLLQESQDPLVLASAKVHLAAWFFAHADVRQAESTLREALEHASPFGESLIRAEALVLQGRLAYAQQAYEQGDMSFTDGLVMLEHLQLYEELIEHLTSYASLLEGRGLLNEAIVYWKQAYTHQQRKRY